MIKNVQCDFFVGGGYCTNDNVQKSMWGMGAKVCSMYYNSDNIKCKWKKDSYIRPSAPPPPPQPKGNIDVNLSATKQELNKILHGAVKDLLSPVPFSTVEATHNVDDLKNIDYWEEDGEWMHVKTGNKVKIVYVRSVVDLKDLSTGDIFSMKYTDMMHQLMSICKYEQLDQTTKDALLTPKIPSVDINELPEFDEKAIADFEFATYINDAVATEQFDRRKQHHDRLSGMSIEERVKLIEEQLYEISLSAHLDATLY